MRERHEVCVSAYHRVAFESFVYLIYLFCLYMCVYVCVWMNVCLERNYLC